MKNGENTGADNGNGNGNGKQNSKAKHNIIPPKPYDAFFRASMQHQLVAKAFFTQELPEKLSNRLDYSTLTPLNTSYIDKDLQSSFSDVCFTCDYDKQFIEQYGQQCGFSDDKFSGAKIIVLVEHQSSPDRFMPFRMLH